MRIAMVGKYVDLDRLLQEPERGARPRRHRQRVRASRSTTSTPRRSSRTAARRACARADGILVPMGFGPRGTEGKIAAVRYAREQQGAVLRHLLRHADGGDRVRAPRLRPRARQLDRGRPADAAPGDRPDARRSAGSTQKGGTMRLGAYPCVLDEGSLAREALRQDEDLRAPPPPLRVQQRLPRAAREARACVLSGLSPDGALVEMIELADHPWFVGCQFHPEFKSRPLDCHPLFKGFIRAALAAARRTRREAPLLGGLQGRSKRLVTRAHASRVGPVAIGGGAPLALIAGPVRDRAPRRGAAPRRAAARRSRDASACRSSSSRPSTRPTAPRSTVVPRRRAWTRGCAILAEVRREIGAAGAHRRARARAGRGRRRGRRRAADAGVPLPADRLHRRGRARPGKPVNVKKGQFLSPVGDGARGREGARDRQRRSSWSPSAASRFGYNNLVADMRVARGHARVGCPVVFDATHSVQLPGRRGHARRAASASSSRRWRAPRWRSGVDAVFLEVHEDPDRALSDGAEPACRSTELPALLARARGASMPRAREARRPARGAVAPSGDARARARGACSTIEAAALRGGRATASTTRFDRAVELLLACRGKVVVTGIGKSGIVCRKIAATLASTGTPAFFLHAGEGSARRPRHARRAATSCSRSRTAARPTEILRLLPLVAAPRPAADRA